MSSLLAHSCDGVRVPADSRSLFSPSRPSSPAKNPLDDHTVPAPRAASPVTLIEESAGGSLNHGSFKRTAPFPLNFIPEPWDLLPPSHGTSQNGAAQTGGLYQRLDGSSKFVPFRPVEPQALKPHMAELDYRSGCSSRVKALYCTEALLLHALA